MEVYGESIESLKQLLSVYFELSSIEADIVSLVDLSKQPVAQPSISADHIGSSQEQEQSMLPDFLNFTEGFTIDADLSAPFSFLGEQIWNFVQLYNKLTTNNNFES